MTEQIKILKTGSLVVKIYSNREALGTAAADEAAQAIAKELDTKDYVNIVFAAAPSQNEFLSSLSQKKHLDWNRVNAFHMDEYLGLAVNHPKSFGNFLWERLFGRVPFHEVFLIDGAAGDPEIECRRYATLLDEHPPDIVCMGIGENTHIAFNDPGLADFNDPQQVKLVILDPVSREQQVHDGCFSGLEEVPNAAITLTVPSLLQAKSIFCMVPGASKSQAVHHTIFQALTNRHPSTILRQHRNAILYLDHDSAEKIQK